MTWQPESELWTFEEMFTALEWVLDSGQVPEALTPAWAAMCEECDAETAYRAYAIACDGVTFYGGGQMTPFMRACGAAFDAIHFGALAKDGEAKWNIDLLASMDTAQGDCIRACITLGYRRES